jgi:hypothetical protein
MWPLSSTATWPGEKAFMRGSLNRLPSRDQGFSCSQWLTVSAALMRSSRNISCCINGHSFVGPNHLDSEGAAHLSDIFTNVSWLICCQLVLAAKPPASTRTHGYDDLINNQLMRSFTDEAVFLRYPGKL